MALDEDTRTTARRWRIGAVTVTEIVELTTVSRLHWLLPDATSDHLLQIPWMRPHYVTEDGKGWMTIRALVVESEGRRIVVDTCLGNGKERDVEVWNRLETPWLDDLVAAGFAPDTIDTVLCTHLHVDHVGWNTRWDGEAWVPTFPKARYLFAAVEWEHWSAEGSGMDAVLRADSVQPVLDAGLVDLIAADAELTSEVRLVPTPGHTPGHVSVVIDSEGERAVITGDLTHNPCQAAHPEWGSDFDVLPEVAEATRRAFFAERVAHGDLVLGTHWEPCAARIELDGERDGQPVYRAVPVLDQG